MEGWIRGCMSLYLLHLSAKSIMASRKAVRVLLALLLLLYGKVPKSTGFGGKYKSGSRSKFCVIWLNSNWFNIICVFALYKRRFPWGIWYLLKASPTQNNFIQPHLHNAWQGDPKKSSADAVWARPLRRKKPSYSLSLVGRANSCGWRRNVIIKGKTWENGLLRAEQMDGECIKIASSISWRYRPTPARWAEES